MDEQKENKIKRLAEKRKKAVVIQLESIQGENGAHFRRKKQTEKAKRVKKENKEGTENKRISFAKQEKAIHAHHRKRLRQRYMGDGPTFFQDHELLEMLLFYAYPRQDTNPIAHKFIEGFNGLNGLLEANPREIISCTGTSERIAILISLIMEFNRKYNKNLDIDKADLSTPEKVIKYLKPFFLGIKFERSYLLCLDSQNKLIRATLIGEGGADKLYFDIQKITKTALHDYSSSVILAHNHPSGNELPSTDDIVNTKKLFTTMQLLRIQLVDHIIMTEKKYFSMAENNLLTGIEL